MTLQDKQSHLKQRGDRSVQMLWKMSVIRSSWICNCHKRRKPDGNGFLIDQVHFLSSVNAMVKQTALCSLAAHQSGQGRAVDWGREREGKCGGMWLLIVHLCGLITELNAFQNDRSAVICEGCAKTKPLWFESTKLTVCCVVYFDILDMLLQPFHFHVHTKSSGFIYHYQCV